MNDTKMTSEQERAFYARAENQTPQGPPRRRGQRMSEPVAVRFSPEVLEQVQKAAAADDRSVSSWIRRAVTAALQGQLR